MNELTAEQWVESFYMPVDVTASEVTATNKADALAENRFGWLGRMTNRSYEAWLARCGVEASVE